MDDETTLRSFVLTPKDRQGVLLGLGWAQISVMGSACLMALGLLMAGSPLLIAAVPAVVGSGVAYGRWGGLRLVEWGPVVWHHLRMRWKGRQWTAGQVFNGIGGDLPLCLRGLQIDEIEFDGRQVGVVSDTGRGRLSALLEVEGTDFMLASEQEQVRLLEGWGKVLGTHAVEGSPVRALSWTQIARRGSLRDHMRWVQSLGTSRGEEAARSYRQLVESASIRTTKHTSYLTVSVAESGRAAKQAGAKATLEEALKDSVRGVQRSLEAAELRRWRLLDAGDVGRMLVNCCDPTASGGLAGRVGTLAERVGIEGLAGCGPREAWHAWAWFETDKCAHVSFVVEDWPRYPVAADWLTMFLARGRWARRVHVCFEPVSPHVAHKRIERQAFKLDADAAQREESGRRISAGWRQAREGVEQREEELVAGYSEMAYYGIVTMSAADGRTLDDAVAGVLSTARGHGITLRPLLGVQDLGWAASLPVGLQAGRKLLSR